jgi:hypothetical protein
MGQIELTFSSRPLHLHHLEISFSSSTEDSAGTCIPGCESYKARRPWNRLQARIDSFASSGEKEVSPRCWFRRTTLTQASQGLSFFLGGFGDVMIVHSHPLVMLLYDHKLHSDVE